MKRISRKWSAITVAGLIGLMVLGLLYVSARGPSRFTCSFLVDREPVHCYKEHHENKQTALYVYSFPAQYDGLCEAARTELTALGFSESPASATPDRCYEFTRSDRRTHVSILLQEAKFLSEESTEERLVFGHEPGWVCVEVLEQHHQGSLLGRLRYWCRRLIS